MTTDPNPGLPMPEDAPKASSEKITIEAPASIGKQTLQLVLIPALIVAFCVGLFYLVGMLLNTSNSDNDIQREKQLLAKIDSSVFVKFAYVSAERNEMWRSAKELSLRINLLTNERKNAPENPTVKDIAKAKVRDQRIKNISDTFAKALDFKKIPLFQDIKSRDTNNTISENDLKIQEQTIAYLILGISKLGQPEHFQTILNRKSSESDFVRSAVLIAFANWDKFHTPQTRDHAIQAALEMLKNDKPEISMRAAVILGKITKPDNLVAINALSQSLNNQDSNYIDTKINAAIALARLGEETGSLFVANTLLNRSKLETLLKSTLLHNENKKNVPHKADKCIYSVLYAAQEMKNQAIWDQIQNLADIKNGDPNKKIKATARNLIENHGEKNKTQ